MTSMTAVAVSGEGSQWARKCNQVGE